MHFYGGPKENKHQKWYGFRFGIGNQPQPFELLHDHPSPNAGWLQRIFRTLYFCVSVPTHEMSAI